MNPSERMDFYYRLLKIHEKLYADKLKFVYVNNKNKAIEFNL